MAYKSLTLAAVLTDRVGVQRRHSLFLGPPSRAALPGPRCLYPELSIAGFGWKLRLLGCGDSILGTRAERVFERYNEMGCSMGMMRVINMDRNDA